MSKKTSPIATSQRRIIIIGATSGIGREVAQIYIAQGHIVGLAADVQTFCRKSRTTEKIYSQQPLIFAAMMPQKNLNI